LDSGEKPLIIVDLEAFEAASNQHSPIPMAGANEVWVDLVSGPGSASNERSTGVVGSAEDAEQVVESMRQSGIRIRDVFDARAMVEARVDQPLVNAGWGALLVLMFLAVALASGSGVMLFSFLDTKERQTESALLRTLGSTGGQLRGIVWFNLFLIVATGVALGTWVGQLIGPELMKSVEEGEQVTPPMAFTTDWFSLMVSYLTLAAVTLATVVWLAWLSAKIQVQQVLRMGDAG
jgi:ABC-type antimicrobial peptide transport system permease subunit